MTGARTVWRPCPSIAVVVLATLVACAARDPRPRALRDPLSSALGGWIEIAARGGRRVDGELLAVADDGALYVLTGRSLPERGWVAQRLEIIAPDQLLEARLTGDDGATYWSIPTYLGTLLSAVTLVGPLLWIAAVKEGDAQLAAHHAAHLPGASVEQLRRWARFPQGPPPGLAARATAP